MTYVITDRKATDWNNDNNKNDYKLSTHICFLVLLDEIKKKKLIGSSNLSNNSSKQLKGVDNYQ